MAILSRFDREQLAGFIAVAIDLADMLDGDADLEDDDPAERDDHDEDDDPSGQSDEDGINTGGGVYRVPGVEWDGPGCPIGDGGI